MHKHQEVFHPRRRLVFFAICSTRSWCVQPNTYEAMTKINSHTFFSTGSSLRSLHQQMSRDWVIPLQRCWLCFCDCVFFSPTGKCEVFLGNMVLKCWISRECRLCISTLENLNNEGRLSFAAAPHYLCCLEGNMKNCFIPIAYCCTAVMTLLMNRHFLHEWNAYVLNAWT